MTAFGGALTDPTKIMGSRIGAYAIDLALGVVVIIGGFWLMDASHYEGVEAATSYQADLFCQEINNRPSTPGEDRIACIPLGTTSYTLAESQLNGTVRHAQLNLIGFSFVNYVLLTAVAGGTVGKLIFGLRVTTAHGKRAGIGRNLVRWLLFIVDAACCWLPGLLTATNTKGHRRVGDLVAGTYVVHRSAEGRLLHIPGHLHVKNRHDYGTFGPAPAASEPTLGTGGGIDAPVFDPSRNTYVRYDQDSGVWFQWDDTTQAWVPAQQ